MAARKKTPTKKRWLVEYEEAYAKYLDALDRAGQAFDARVREILESIPRDDDVAKRFEEARVAHPPPQRPTSAPRMGEAWVTPCTNAILVCLARFFPLPRSQKFVAVFTGYSTRSGSWAKSLAALRRHGMIADAPDGTKIALTEKGRASVPTDIVLPSGYALIEMWAGKLGPAGAHVFRSLVERYPNAQNHEDIAASASPPYSTRSGSWAKALAKLRKLDLVEGSSADMRLHREAAAAIFRTP